MPANRRSAKNETDVGQDYRGAFLRHSNYALALTRTQAFTWDYTSASPTSIRTFDLTNPTSARQPLPLGSFVSTGQASETGLVVVNPSNGRMTYWESIENADALSLFEQRRNGIDGSCGSLMSGEVVVDIVAADHAGFILIFSSGRIAQLLVRDTQARPSIKVNFFKSQQGSGGFLGGLRSAIGGGGWVKNVVAVQTRLAQMRGDIEAVVAIDDAHFQFWSLNISGHLVLHAECDVKRAIASTVSTALHIDELELNTGSADVKILDFSIMTATKDTSAALSVITGEGGAHQAIEMVVLANVVASGYSKYVLLELEVVSGESSVRRTIPLDSYDEPLFTGSSSKPRLGLSSTCTTAFVFFDKSIVLVSLVAAGASSETQQPFQDSIYLREDGNYYIAGMGTDIGTSRSSQSSASLFIRGCGLVRITMAEPTDEEQTHEALKISVKSKLEQAVYFGTMPGNPIDLSRRSALAFDLADVEEASLQISKDVCATESSFVSSVAPSMDFHLEQRARILQDLAIVLKRIYPELSRLTKWKLRWDAEKMAAARTVWTLYDNRAKGSNDESRLLPQTLMMIGEHYKTETDTDKGERDEVRQWFLKDIWRMENLVQWAYRALYELDKENEIKDEATYLELLSDAGDIVLGSLETAFKFRTESASAYGLEKERLREGVLEEGHAGLTQFWTSQDGFVKFFPDFIRITVDKLMAASASGDVDLLQKILSDQPRLIDVYCKACEERHRCLLASIDNKSRSAAELFKQNYDRSRISMLTKLADIGLAEEGMALAEKYSDMPSLVSLVRTQLEEGPQIAISSDDGNTPEAEKHHARVVEDRIDRYFKIYGTTWAEPFYSDQLARGEYMVLFDGAESQREEFTHYLRAEPDRKKISWINDIIFEKDCKIAAQTLLDVADHQEQQIWSKKVELSLAVLALAADEQFDDETQAQGTRQANALQVVNIQERLYEHVHSSLHNALDQTAEVQLAMETYGRHVVKGKTACHGLLEQGFEMLVKHAVMDLDQLVDVLTLIDQRPNELRHKDIAGLEFVLALQAVKAASAKRPEESTRQQLKFIWRRCFIRDGWKVHDATARKSDQERISDLEATVLFRTIYEGFASGMSLRSVSFVTSILTISQACGTMIRLCDCCPQQMYLGLVATLTIIAIASRRQIYVYLSRKTWLQRTVSSRTILRTADWSIGWRRPRSGLRRN